MKTTTIKLWRAPYHVVVRLYDTIKELKKETGIKSVAGFYRPEPYAVYPRTRIRKKLGTIYLAKERLGVGYITHEVLHCVFDYGAKALVRERAGIDPFLNDEDKEEKMAGEQGWITKEICNWLNDKNLWK